MQKKRSQCKKNGRSLYYILYFDENGRFEWKRMGEEEE